MNSEDEQAVEEFENEVIDRLFALNALRSEEEKRLGVSLTSRSRGGKRGHKAQAGVADGQFELGLDDRGWLGLDDRGWKG
jgi:hypothetical protein